MNIENVSQMLLASNDEWANYFRNLQLRELSVEAIRTSVRDALERIEGVLNNDVWINPEA
ncbi:MAG: hypothetical protein ABW007_03060 [Chitinophagaceae bacterium]